MGFTPEKQKKDTLPSYLKPHRQRLPAKTSAVNAKEVSKVIKAIIDTLNSPEKFHQDCEFLEAIKRDLKKSRINLSNHIAEVLNNGSST